MRKSNNIYPRLVEVSVDGIFSKVFENANGNEEFCRPTGMELQESADVADHWLEFEDSLGGLHYGR